MKKLKIISTMLCAAMLLVQTACSQTTGANAVVAKVNDTNIYRWELDNYYEQQLPYANDSNGVNLEEAKYSQDRHEYRLFLLEDLINQRAVMDYGKANGYDLTEEDKKEVQKEFDDAKKAKKDQFIQEKFSGDADAEGKAEKEWKSWLEENHYTEDSLYQDMYDHKVYEKIGQETYDKTTVTDEQLQKKYDEMVEAQKTEYTAKPSLYIQAAQVPSGLIVYNLPGYVRIKYLNIDIPEDINEQIKELDNKAQALIVERTLIAQQKGEDSQAFKDSQASEEELKKQTKELYDKAYEQIRGAAEEALQKTKAGEDFDQLMKEYGDDPIFDELGIRDIGYLVGPDSNDITYDVLQQALKLKNEGDTSELIKSELGFTIVKLVSKVPEGPIPMNDEIREYWTQQIKMDPLYKSMEEVKSKARAEAEVTIMEDQV